MSREIIFTYTPTLLRRAAWNFSLRYFGWGGLIAEAVALILFTYFYSTDSGSSFTVMFGFLFFFGLATFVFGYLAIVRRSMEQYRKMRSPQVTFRFSDETIYTKSDLGVSEMPWGTIDKLWKSSHVWLLMVTKVNYITLPADALDEELKQLISTKLER